VSAPRLVWHQFRFDQKTFWRNPASVFFTVALPVAFLVLLQSIFGGRTYGTEHGEISGAVYYVPGLLALALVSATFVNLAISLTRARERGVLKRLRSTPLPPWVFIAGRIGTSVVVSLLMTVLLVGLGRALYGVAVPGATLPAVLLAVVVGAASFCALGFALAALIPSEGAAPPITNAIVLPLYFVSGVFIPSENVPEAMGTVAGLFPLKPLFDALLAAFDAGAAGTGIAGRELLVVATWGLAGLLFATRAFRWTPRGE
jgi:ABC-2 type transport system permease protein